MPSIQSIVFSLYFTKLRSFLFCFWFLMLSVFIFVFLLLINGISYNVFFNLIKITISWEKYFSLAPKFVCLFICFPLKQFPPALQQKENIRHNSYQPWVPMHQVKAMSFLILFHIPNVTSLYRPQVICHGSNINICSPFSYSHKIQVPYYFFNIYFLFN